MPWFEGNQQAGFIYVLLECVSGISYALRDWPLIRKIFSFVVWILIKN